MNKSGDDAEFKTWLTYIASKIADETFYTKVAGVSHANDDGTSRQELVSMCEPRQWLNLEADPGNAFHKKAVRVLTEDGHQLGFLDRRCAQEITNKAIAGDRFAAAVCGKRKAEEAKFWGLVIVIFRLNAAYRLKVV